MTRIQAGSIQLDYQIRGQGPSLLMINGFRRSRVVWMEDFLRAMEGQFRMILFDNRGTGNSDQPEAGYSIEGFADDCAALLEALGIAQTHVFGVSMGGMIAQALATRHPEQVKGLAIGCSHCGKSGAIPSQKDIWELLRLLPGPQMDAREVAYRQEAAYVTEAFRAANRAFLDDFFETVQQNPTPEHAVKGHLRAIEAWDGCGQLGQIKAPTLVITGAEDRLIPAANSTLMAERIPGAELCLLPDSAHFFWLEKPRETAKALGDFFGKL